MGIFIGIGNYIGRAKIITGGKVIIDNVIISEDSSYIITESGLYIEKEQIEAIIYLIDNNTLINNNSLIGNGDN